MTTTLHCVVDASVSIKQFIPDPLSDKAKQLFERLNYPTTQLFVPDLFYIESTNIIWKYVRAGEYAADDAAADLASLKDLSLRVVSTAELMSDAFAIALAHGISAYDAAYVTLSEQVNAPLLTLDKKLVRALANAAYDIRYFADFSIPQLP